MIYKLLKEFPYLKEFSEKFTVDDNTIFAYDGIIYTNHDLPDDIIEHEVKHLSQQNKIGADKWIKNYLTDDKFRLEQEIQAFKVQLGSYQDKNLRNECRIKCARSLASDLYGGIISYDEAFKKLYV